MKEDQESSEKEGSVTSDTQEQLSRSERMERALAWLKEIGAKDITSEMEGKTSIRFIRSGMAGVPPLSKKKKD